MTATGGIERRGFWRGVLAGLAAAAVGLLALAVFYPPAPSAPPQIAPGAAVAPEPSDAPDLGAGPEAGGLGPLAPGPLIPARPEPPELSAEPSPSLAPLPPVDPEATGPSLAPQDPD